MLRLTKNVLKPRGKVVSAKKKRAVKTELAKDTTQRYRSLPITSAQDHIQKVAQQRYRNDVKNHIKIQFFENF